MFNDTVYMATRYKWLTPVNLCIVVAVRWTELSENLRYLALPAPDRGLSPVPVGVHLKGAGEAVLGSSVLFSAAVVSKHAARSVAGG